MLLEKNIGERLSIDEACLCNDLFTFLSNKDGHGRQGSIIAAWYKNVSSSKIKELISATNTIRSKEDEVLNYFINRSTNAAAES